jgi:hypothetical protein
MANQGGVPTIDESGVKGYESLSWSGIAVAAGTLPGARSGRA